MKTLLLYPAFVLFAVQLSFGQLEWTYTDLSEPRSCLDAASLGTKVYFAGGMNENGLITTVEVYDVANSQWEIIGNLSLGRRYPTAVSCGSKILFAGGINLGQSAVFSRVDIYDTITRQWEIEELSVPRFGIGAVSYGTKVYFAGGISFPWVPTNIVDIYDIETGEMTTDILSVARGGIAAAVVGDLAIFAGGTINQGFNSSRVDLFNFTTGVWSIAQLSQARCDASATAVGDKILIAGGYDDLWASSNMVDIFDYSDNTWSTAELSYPRCSMGNAATVNDKAYFAGGGDFYYGFFGPSNVIDIFEDSTNTWTVDNLIWPLLDHAVTGLGDYLIIAGGENDNEVIVSTVSIGKDTSGLQTYVPSYSSFKPSVVSYPNPTDGISHFSFLISQYQQVLLKIYDIQGREVAVILDEKMPAGKHTVSYDMSSLPSGIYFYRLTAIPASAGTGGQRLTASGKIVKY